MRAIASGVLGLFLGHLDFSCKWFVLGVSVFSAALSAVLAPIDASAAPMLTPQQVQALQSLSAAEKIRLANQYGVKLPRSAAPASRILSETPLEPRTIAVEEKPKEELEKGPIDPLVKLRYGNLKRFGYNLFESEPTTFAPVGGVPAPEKYVIGSGDRLRVFLFGKESAEYDLVVNRDGTLIIPDLDRLNVQGLSFETVRNLIEERVKERKIGVTAVVTLDELRSIQVFILGDVNQPGSFAVSAFSTLVNALFVAGGVSEQGSLRNIQLKRDGQTIATLDLYDLLLRGDAEGDVRVRQGDVIFVPAVGDQVAVKGEVKRPAIFEFKDGESLEDLVWFASGMSGFAFEREVRVRRTVNGVDRISKSVDRDELRVLSPLDGDVVEVLSVNALPTETIQLSGLFSRPGFRQWEPGLMLSDVITSPRDLMISPLESLLVIENRDIQGQLRVDLIRGSEVFSDPVTGARGLGNNDRITLVPNIRSRSVDNKDMRRTGENPETEAFGNKIRFDRSRFFEELNQRVIASSALTQVPPLVDVSGIVNQVGTYPLSTRATVGTSSRSSWSRGHRRASRSSLSAPISSTRPAWSPPAQSSS
jgi:polysaccharide export outer membrane protein